MKTKLKQEDIVLMVVKDMQPIRTERVKILCMAHGISCSDRYLRWLSEKGLVRSYKEPKDRTKTWVTANENT